MSRWLSIGVLLFFAASLPACAKTARSKHAPEVATVHLRIGSGELKVEVARTPEEMARGLMFRKSLPKDTGMLFVFPTPQSVAFWMKNTYVPLTVAYVSADGKVLEFHDLQPLSEEPVPSRSSMVMYAIEAEQGWFAQHKISSGTPVIPLGTTWDKLHSDSTVSAAGR